MNIELSEYLKVLERDPVELACVSDIFSEFLKLTQFIKITNSVIAEDISFTIIPSMGLRAYCRRNEIAISRGLIDFALNSSAPTTSKNPIYYQPNDPSKFNRIGALLWIVAHEYIHLARGHDKIWNDCPRLALEYDADCFAVASLYRYFSGVIYPTLKAIEVKKIVLSAIYWPLRELINKEVVDSQQDRDHPDWYVRLHGAIYKLSCLGVPHINLGVTEEWKETLGELLLHQVTCEDSYTSLHHKTMHDKIVRDEEEIFTAESFETTLKILGKIGNLWKSIEPAVKKSSRMLEDLHASGASILFANIQRNFTLFLNGWRYSSQDIRGVMMPNFHARTGADKSVSYRATSIPISYGWTLVLGSNLIRQELNHES